MFLQVLIDRQFRDKQAKAVVKQRAAACGWDYSASFGAPLYNLINQVRGKKITLTSESATANAVA